MKILNVYKQLGLNSGDKVFDYFISNLKKTNRTFEFFIDWAKVFQNIENVEVELNIMNYLIGKQNIHEEFIKLIKQYPKVVSVIPLSLIHI